REQCLEDGETFRRYRAGGALDRRFAVSDRLGGELRQRALVALAYSAQALRDLPAERRWGLRNRAAVLAQDPRGELRKARVPRDEDTVLDLAAVAVGALDPLGRVAGDLDLRLADERADLPGGAAAILVDLELG